MKKTAALLATCLCLLGRAQDIESQLDSLFKNNEFFKLQSLLENNTGNIDPVKFGFYSCLCDNAFNRCEKSAQGINNLLLHLGPVFTDSQKLYLFEAQIYNYLKLFDYNDAKIFTDKTLAELYRAINPKTEAAYANLKRITDALAGAPPQTLEPHSDVRIKTYRDAAGLLRLPVLLNGAKKPTYYIFDTGANISVVPESQAKKWKLRMLVDEVKVTSSTGNKVQSRIGIADSLKIGGLTLHNVIFLVLPDKSLTFGSFFFKYKIKGIIGYPIMQQLKEVQLLGEKELLVPAQSTDKGIRNLAVKGYSPIISVNDENNDTLCFIFDSGAKKTNLFKRYLDKNNAFVTKNGHQQNVRIAGAGGTMKIPVYMLGQIKLQTGNDKALVKKVAVYANSTHNEELDDYYGLLGQDFIKQFKKTTLNFEYMYIDFE